VHWVEPRLVAEITCLTWTGDGLLRHTVYVGLRDDKPAELVRREPARFARRVRQPEAIVVELSKAPSCRQIVFETGRMAPVPFHGLTQRGFRVVCVESRRPIRRSSRLRPTRPIETMLGVWRIWLALTSSSPCM
jgi:hypothetical protein